MPKLSVIPVCSALPARQSGRCEREYQISLVTPLFGGGAEPGKTDKDFPIRGTSIRGHLRFWWRATKGYRLGARMWQREEEVFGSTEFPSPLDIRVLSQPKVVPVGPTYGERFGPIAYALFSAIENKQQVMKEGGVFRLQLAWANRAELENRRKAQNVRRRADGKPPLPDTVDDIEPDITAAFQAWCAFGGLGARTRRGCGAIFCQNLVSELPGLDARILVARPCTDALKAWEASLTAYRGFRQSFRGPLHSKTLKSGKTVKVPGRTYWPEADSIRKITGSALKQPDHSTPIVPPETLPAFPRALLGLPINFHFADGPGKGKPGRRDLDPQNVRLIPIAPDGADGDRMASPVITRPLWLNGQWYPGVVILNRRIPNGLHARLVGERARADGTDLSFNLSPNEVESSSLAVLRPMRGKASVLDALCDYLTNNGFCEIKR